MVRCSAGQKLFEETCALVREREGSGALKDGEFTFVRYMLSRADLSDKERAIVTLSLFADGLSTVLTALLPITQPDLNL